MENQSSDAYISEIVTHLYKNQYVYDNTVNAIANCQEKQLCAWIGLLNILYNEVIMLKNNKIRCFDCGNILYLRGEILKQYAHFLGSFVPEPAYSLISFEFQSFSKFCNDRGLINLIRHSRGIYPEVDSNKTKPLQFLPYYKQLMNQGPAIVGNYNWEEARKLMKKIFKEEITPQQRFISENADDHQMRDISQKQDQLSIGVKLSKILLTGQWSDLQKYVNDVSKRIFDTMTGDECRFKIENNIQLRRLNFWYKNYQKFLDQGLQYYRLKGNISEDIPLVYEFHVNNIQQIIISLIETIAKVNGQNFQLGSEFQSKCIWLVEFIKTSNQIPNLEQRNEKKKFNVNKFLFLAYVHTIIQLLIPDIQMENSPGKVFLELVTYANPMQQPYYRIFLDDNELLELYTSGRLVEFPHNYNYGPELMPKILKAIIQTNPNKLVQNIDNIAILKKPKQKLQLLIINKLLGDIQNINKNKDINRQTQGQKILKYFQKNMEEFKNILFNQKKQPVAQIDTIKFYMNFIKQWKGLYQLVRCFNLQGFLQFISKYQSKNIHHVISQNKIQSNIKKSDFIFPIHRSDIQYYLFNIFLKMLEIDKNAYLSKIQQQNLKSIDHEQQIKQIRKKLIDAIKIMQNEKFLKILQNIETNKFEIINGNNLQQIKEQRKCQFIDNIWSIYAEILLMIGQFCKDFVNGEYIKKNMLNKKGCEEKSIINKGKNIGGMLFDNRNRKAQHQYVDVEELGEDDENDLF